MKNLNRFCTTEHSSGRRGAVARGGQLEGWRRAGCVLILAMAWAVAVPAAEVKAPPIPREQSEAYVALVKADRARDKESWREAIEGYQKALKIYQEMAAANPDWQPEIVQYRITYCGNQITAITGKSGKSVEEILALPAEGAEPADTAIREKYLALQKENQYLHQRVSQMEDEQEEQKSATTPLPGGDEAGVLKAENQKLREELEQSKNRADLTATVDPEHHRQTVLENDSLKSQLAGLQREAESLRQSQDTYRKEAAAATALQQQTAYLQQRVQEMESEHQAESESRAQESAGWQQQVEQLTSTSQQLQKNLDQQSAELAAETARANSAATALGQLRLELPKWQGMADQSASEAERLTGENKNQQTRLDTQSKDLQRIRAAAEQDAEALLHLQAENKDLKAQLADRSGAVKDLQKKVQELSWNQDELKSLRQEMAVRTQENEALEKEVNAYAFLRQEKKDLEDALARSAGELDSLRQSKGDGAAKPAAEPREREDLQRQLDAQKSENEKLQKQIEQLHAAAAQPPRRSISAEPAAAAGPGLDAGLESGRAMEKNGNYSGAIGEYERVLEQDADTTDAAKGLARCHLKLGDSAKSIEILEKITAANSMDADAQLLLGLAYCADLRFDRAVELLKRLVASDPDNANAHSALGAAWMGLGTLDSARQELEQAIRQNPSLGDAHLNLAQVLCFSSPPDLKTAREHYDRARVLGAAQNPELEKMLTAP